jgi:hypothetical protein
MRRKPISGRVYYVIPGIIDCDLVFLLLLQRFSLLSLSELPPSSD